MTTKDMTSHSRRFHFNIAVENLKSEIWTEEHDEAINELRNKFDIY